MTIVLVYMVLIGKLQYTIIEPMSDMNQCRRMKVVVESSEKVLDVRCAALILDREKENTENDAKAKQ